MDLRAPLCHLLHACWAEGIANGASEWEIRIKGLKCGVKTKEAKHWLSQDWLRTYREAKGTTGGSASWCAVRRRNRQRGADDVFTGWQAAVLCPFPCYYVSVNTKDSWRNVTQLIKLSLFRGHSHDFVSNRAAVSMETGVAPHYVQHLVLVASSSAVGCETHVEHVSYVQKNAFLYLLFPGRPELTRWRAYRDNGNH